MSKKELIRGGRRPVGVFSVDFTGKKNGRGAYICPNAECFAKAKKAKRLERQFECPIPEEIYEKLTEELSKNG
jgi:predicted RNA-binding protein YlxR (DUF448 family)